MKNARRVISVLLMIVLLFPCCGIADGAYELLKTLMSMEIVSDIEAPDYMDVSSMVDEIAKTTWCSISLHDRYIAISGRNQNNKFESLLYSPLSQKQLYLYTLSVCTMFESIDKAKTTANDFMIYMVYGKGEGESLLISDAKTAEKVSDVLAESIKD